MEILVLIASLVALVAIILALGALGLAAFDRSPATEGEDLTGRIAIALFDLANSLFISRLGGVVGNVLAPKPKRPA